MKKPNRLFQRFYQYLELKTSLHRDEERNFLSSLGPIPKRFINVLLKNSPPRRGKGQNTPDVAIYPIGPEPAQRGASFINR